MNTLINSINQVSHACANAEHASSESVDSIFAESIVNAINNISTLYEEFKKDYNAIVKLKRGKTLKAICKLSGITIKTIMPHDYHKRISHSKKISILKMLNHTNNENLHSDFIARLFDPSVMGDFSNQFLKSMLADYPDMRVEHAQLPSIEVSRERRLDSINTSLKGEEIGQHRIDILVETKGYFLLIENKIMAHESVSQTETYYREVSKAWENEDDPKRSKGAYYLLSPSGLVGNCNKFKSITYMDIYKKMIEFEKYIQEDSARQFFEICMNEISQCILKPMLKGIDNANKYLKENNHEFK